jgi:branched-chain amino acid transport system substrate-binding protein
MKKWLMAAAFLGAATIGTVAMADTPGVTETELKIGNTIPYSGAVSSYSPIGKLDTAVFTMINEQGGVAGRKENSSR